MSDGRAKVVIIGAGFGGLAAAKALERTPVDVTVIDRQNHHCFQPLLYQVATAALSPADVAWPIRHILRKQQNATVLMAEVRGIDTAQATGAASIRSTIPYDYLVLATGATHSYFGHDEWADVRAGPQAHRGCDPHPATHPHRLRARRDRNRRGRARRLLTFAIVGGGATGVEMAGAIAEVARQKPRHGFPQYRSDARRASC